MKNVSRRLGTLTCLILILAAQTPAAGSITLPLKPGQTSIDSPHLPFACITVATVGKVIPIEKLVIESLDSHKTMTAQLGKTFNRLHPDYPVGVAGSDSLSMVVMELKPGRYQVIKIEFTPMGLTVGVPSYRFVFPKEDRFCFTVKPGCVNYIGCISLEADWTSALVMLVSPRGEGRFVVAYNTSNTAKRDAKWAARAFPCIEHLPATESVFGEKP